tara:strand:+ start:8842 stop:10089 length:1248 start_codon:yes stop_codon:yes gene_type:complete
MALRLRRGTQAERDDAGFIPDSGEPVWTIDTKRLYIGDGTTPGGNLITASGGGSITGITDTTTGPVITLDDVLATFSVDIEMSTNADITIGSTSQLNGAGSISITGNVTGTDFNGNAASFASVVATGGLNGDLKGSVFASDSALIVDGINGDLFGTLNASQIVASSNILTIDNGGASAEVGFEINGQENNGVVTLVRKSSSDLDGDTSVKYGQINFTRNDSVGTLTTGVIYGREDSIYIGQDSEGDLSTANKYVVWKNQKLGIGITSPTVELDVIGSASISNYLAAGAISLTASTIDTTDSSTLLITPPVTMSSDLTVENNLVVSNTLVCDTLEVTNFTATGAGTPELTSDTGLLLTAGTRVEVTQSPFKLASFTDTERDALSAENGDMIYNTDNNRPEMYVNGAWKIVDTSPIV